MGHAKGVYNILLYTQYMHVIFHRLSVILANKPLKALCLSFKMVYQHLLYLLSLWTY